MNRLKKAAALFTQFLLTSLFLWGLGGLIYYAMLSVSKPSYVVPNASAEDPYRLLLPLINALLEGFALTLTANLLADRVKKTTPARIRYSQMAGVAFLLSFVLSNVVFGGIGQLLRGKSLHLFRLEVRDLPFYLGTTLVGMVLFHLITRDRKRTLKISEQEFQLLQVQQRQTKAELAALQARINPHFLYNALNSIASLVHEDPDRAERMVLLLSRFFRYSTGGHSEPYDTLKQELGIVETYLEVEKVRFDERLQYRILLNDPGAEQLLIPRFLLQPLVENAIKHGIARNPGHGLIEVKIELSGDGVSISVHDNGPAFPEGFTMGYGLKGIEEKLRLLYGNRAAMDIGNGARKEVCIRLPLKGVESVLAKPAAALS